MRATEELIKNFDKYYKTVESKAKPHRSNEIVAIEDELSVFIGTKVAIKEKNGKGKIIIDFYDVDDLNRIIELLNK